jgi:hypothetical protein
MNVLSKDARHHHPPGPGLAALGLTMLMALAAPPTAEASKLLRPAVASPGSTAASSSLSTRAVLQTAMAQRVNNYYARALSAQSTRATRQAGMQYFLVANEDGVLEDNSVVQYLTWRRGLNTTRFDQYHPLIGQMIRRSQQANVTPSLPAVPTIPTTPTTPTLPPIVIDGGPSPQVPIPEPGTLAIGLALTAFGALAHRRRRKAASQES